MNIEAQISELANEFAADLGERQSRLQKQLAEIETKKVMVEAQLESAKLGVKRLLDFKPTIDGQHQCPRCFIMNGNRAAARPIASDVDVLDAWRCSACNYEFTTRV